MEAPETWATTGCGTASPSSVSDLRLRDLAVTLDDLVLQYGDHLGHAGLRAMVAADGPGLRAEDVLLTPGAAGALFIVATTLLAAGDHSRDVPTTPPASRRPVPSLPTSPSSTWRTRRAGRSTRTGSPRCCARRRASCPSPRPTTPGEVVPEADLARIIAAVEALPALPMLLVDETYRELTFGTAPPLAASRSARVISVSSLSKAYGLPGIRLGWLVTRDRELFERTLAAKEQMVITGSTVDEAIGFEAVRHRDELLAPSTGAVAPGAGRHTCWCATGACSSGSSHEAAWWASHACELGSSSTRTASTPGCSSATAPSSGRVTGSAAGSLVPAGLRLAHARRAPWRTGRGR
ncbi:MAG: pyridoxal phosphate-dependent aminotransferase [Chloroflexota bacterium]